MVQPALPTADSDASTCEPLRNAGAPPSRSRWLVPPENAPSQAVPAADPHAGKCRIARRAARRISADRRRVGSNGRSRSSSRRQSRTCSRSITEARGAGTLRVESWAVRATACRRVRRPDRATVPFTTARSSREALTATCGCNHVLASHSPAGTDCGASPLRSEELVHTSGDYLCTKSRLVPIGSTGAPATDVPTDGRRRHGRVGVP